MMVHQDYKEMLAAKALTALDAEDAHGLDTHLESCVDCRTELKTWQETAALIALDARRIEPSTQLRELILMSVRAEGGAKERARDSVGSSAEPKDRQADSRVLPFERPQRTPLRSFTAIAAALAIGALIISLLMLWQQNRAVRQELARLSTELQQAQAQLNHESSVVALLTSPDAHMAKLAGTKDAPGAHAMLAYDKNGNAMLMARGLPAVPKGMAYQLWYIKDNKKMPGRVFSPDAAGNGILEDHIPAVARDAAVFAITLEPESGVPVPTGSIYLVSST